MSEPDFSAVRRKLRSCVLAKSGQLTNEELQHDYIERTGLVWPFRQFESCFFQAMKDCGCSYENGRWRCVSVDNPHVANLLVNLSKMEPNRRRNQRGSRFGGGQSGVRAPPQRSSWTNLISPASNQGSTINNRGVRLETNFQYRNGFSNKLSDWPEDSPDDNDNRSEIRRNETQDRNHSRGGNDGSYQGNHPNTRAMHDDRRRPTNGSSSSVRDSETSRHHVHRNGNDPSDNEVFAPPGIVPGSGFRHEHGSRFTPDQPTQSQSPSQYSRISSTTPLQLPCDALLSPSEPREATFHFPPPKKNDKSNSIVPLEKPTSGNISYDQLCHEAVSIFANLWPGALTADELMNTLARKTNLPELVGPNSMEHHETIIAMIHQNERSIFVKNIDGEKVYSYIPGTPDASNENDLYEQVGKMLSLVLHTYDDMTVESAQSRLGFPDSSQFSKLNGCALILEVSKQNMNIIVGQSNSGHGKDRRLSLKCGASVADFRSQIRLSRRSTDFTKTLGLSAVHRNADRSQEDKIKQLLYECENYAFSNFPIYKAHPIAEMGPEDEIEFYEGTMVYYSTLDKFAVRIDNDGEHYQSVQTYLQEDYEGIEWDEVFLKYIKEGAAVGVKQDNGKFARGIVSHYEGNPDDKSFVYLVDEGCLDEVSINNIFPLKDSMKDLHPLGMRCTIGAFKINSKNSDKYYEEHREIWKTLNIKSFIKVFPKGVVACGGKKELVVHLKFESRKENYDYPNDLIENNIIVML